MASPSVPQKIDLPLSDPASLYILAIAHCAPIPLPTCSTLSQLEQLSRLIRGLLWRRKIGCLAQVPAVLHSQRQDHLRLAVSCARQNYSVNCRATWGQPSSPAVLHPHSQNDSSNQPQAVSSLSFTRSTIIVLQGPPFRCGRQYYPAMCRDT